MVLTAERKRNQRLREKANELGVGDQCSVDDFLDGQKALFEQKHQVVMTSFDDGLLSAFTSVLDEYDCEDGLYSLSDLLEAWKLAHSFS